MSRPEDGYVLQVIEIVSEKDPIVVLGLAFGTISVGDCLSIDAIDDESSMMIVSEIMAYGTSLKKADRGDQPKFTLLGKDEFTFGDERYVYLYKMVK